MPTTVSGGTADDYWDQVVSELVELAGGTDVFATLSSNKSATDRVVTEEVIEAAPDIIIASWCGKR